MAKFLRVMNGLKSHAGGFEYKLNEVNVAEVWNPSADNQKDIGGFNFTDEEHMLRWLLRGNVLYDVELPDDAEVLMYEGNNPKGVYRTNKIIVKNPRDVTEEMAMDLYLKSTLPLECYFQCLCFLCFKDFDNVCLKIIEDKVNNDNIDNAIKVFSTFFDIKEEDENECYKMVKRKLNEIKEMS